jgi:hypothetical protein
MRTANRGLILCTAMALGLGASHAVALDTPLSEASVVITAEGHEDHVGASLAGVGDVNGDGLDDFLIGAPEDDVGDIQAGQAYLILGSEGGYPHSLGLGFADASYWGEGSNDFAGTSVAGAGDVNGDGFADFLIGAYRNGDAATQAGKVYVVLGADSGWSPDTPLESVDISYLGEGSGDWAGSVVAGGGDVNGDGFDDFLVGAPANEEVAPMAGQTYLVFGRATGMAQDTSLSLADASFLGEAEDDQSGCALAIAGDVNGDGFDDVLIGAMQNGESASAAGQAYLVLGSDSGLVVDTSLAQADASFLGESMASYAGQAVAGAGDVNGDGLDDFLVGAYRDGEAGSQAGQTYLILGRESGWAPDSWLVFADASFLGEAAGDSAGSALAGGGDVDGDGLADILIGAGDNGENGSDAGQIYLITGRTHGWSKDLLLADSDESFLGEAASDHAGAAVAFVGDVNGDGHEDLLTGAWGHDDVGTDAGRGYLFFCFDMDDDGVRTCDGDCADTVATAYPGAEETCDGVDSDCDGVLPADEVDDDQDGWTVCGGDCNDADPAIHPGAPELCDTIDNDCDEDVDEATDVDDDGDGVTECDGDCDDADATVFPGAPEICDELDNDCNGVLDDVDADADGFIDDDCRGDDCDDSRPEVHPDHEEICDDGLDNDCDDLIDDEEEECQGDDDTGDDDSADDDTADDDTTGPDDDDSAVADDDDDCSCEAAGPAEPSPVLGMMIGLLALALRRRA